MVFTQAPKHRVSGGKQAVVQTPLLQFCPDGHTVPHVPQLFGSVCLLTQTPLQTERPNVQLCTQALLAHFTVPPTGGAQACPQLPQFSALVDRFVHVPLQFV